MCIIIINDDVCDNYSDDDWQCNVKIYVCNDNDIIIMPVLLLLLYTYYILLYYYSM